MQPSTETRWFFKHRENIIDIEEWFAGYDLKLSEGLFERQDYYLKLAGLTSLGLKIREPKKNSAGEWVGKLEAKVLVKEFDLPTIPGGNSGNGNQWTKFSFNLPAGESTLVEILDGFSSNTNLVAAEPHHWIRMDKNRILVMYDLEKKEFAKSDQRMTLTEGCGIELTALRLKDVVYYSFGLEAFSGTFKAEHNLFETLKTLFNELSLTGLSKENSLTYPEFLLSKMYV